MILSQALGYPLLFVAALELALGIVLLRQDHRKNAVNRSVALFALFAAAFTLSTAIMYIRASLGLEYNLFARLSWIGWFTIPAAIQTVFFLGNAHSAKARLTGWVLYPFWLAALLLALFTDLVVTSAYRLYPYANVHGPLENLFRLAGGALIFWLMVEILLLRRRVSGMRRAQLNYFFYGTLIFGIGGSVTASFLQLFGGFGVEPGLASYFSFPWVLLTFYAITRYRLFDLRIVISRVLNILFLSLLVSFIQFLLFKAIEPALGTVVSLFISMPVIGFVLFGTPVSRTMQRWVNDLVLGDRYAYQQMLNRSAKAAVTILDLDDLLRYLMDSVRAGLGVGSACLFLRDHQGRYFSRKDYGVHDAVPPGSGPPQSVIDHLSREPRPIVRVEFASSFRQEERDIARVLEEAGAELVLPLLSKGQLLGVLSLGERSTGDVYLESDIEVLQALAGHAAVAIENARLFEEARKMRVSLREQEGIFRTLAQTLPAAIFIHRGGKFLYANPAGVRMSGYSMEEILGMDFWSLTHPDYRQLILARGRARLDGNDPPPQYEFKIVRKDGAERWVLMTAGTVEYEGQSAVIGTIFDITDRKKAEEDKERLFAESEKHLQARLEEQHRHQAEKENILRDLHDGIGGLTTNINLLAELARQSSDLDAVRGSLATIAELSRESLSEIRGFIQCLDSRELSWQAAAAELRHLGSAMIEPHGVRFSLTTRVPESGTMPSSMVAMNLFHIYKESLANIVKHAKATEVAVRLTVAEGRIVLDVRDNGIGLAGEQGAGRGLKNMKTRSEEVGGSFFTSSEHGTRIVSELPIP